MYSLYVAVMYSALVAINSHAHFSWKKIRHTVQTFYAFELMYDYKILTISISTTHTAHC